MGIFDKELRLVWASQPYLDILCRDRLPLERPLQDMARREDNLPFFGALEATAEDGLRRTVRNASGDYGLTFDNVMSRVGEYLVVESTDVTAKVQAEERQNLARASQQAVTNQMQELVVMIDFQLRSVVVNEPCTEVFGDFEWLTRFIASGKPFGELDLQFPIDDPEGKLRQTFEIGVKVMETGESFRGVLELPTLNGERIFQVVAERWEHEGVVRGLIELKMDITDAVKAHRQLASQRQELAASSLVKTFAQGVAHDSGNVAQVVKGYAQLLEANPVAEVVAAAIHGLNSAADRSVRLAHDISEIARIGEVPSGPVELSALVNSHLPSLQRAAGEDIHVSLAVSGPVVVLGNEAQLRSILDNLCQNSARAMGGRGSIDIHSADAGDHAVLRVRDDGPGLPAGLQGRLFEPFNSSPESRAAGGTGLGLYLLSEHVKSMSGTIEVDTGTSGTTFTVSLPLAPGPRGPPERAP